MARTPLFRSLERALRLARAANLSGRSPAELDGEARERRMMTRRELLRTSAVAAAGLGLAGCRLPRTVPGEEPRVLIIGAGIAGLTAGYRLKARGVPVRIFEAQERIGGRMFSQRDFFADGQVAELGGELIDTGHTAIRGLAEELGIPLDDLWADDPALEDEVWFFDDRAISGAEVVEAYRPVAERITADLATLAEPWATYDAPNGAEALDRMTLKRWIEEVGVDGWFRRLLDVGYTTEYGLEIDRQSALNLHFLIDPRPDPFRIYGDSDERFHVRGGNDRIPHALAAELEPEIDLGSRLEAVRQRADGHFECTLRKGSTSVTRSAPFLILALPFTLLRQVDLDVELPPVKRRAIAELGYGTNAKLMMGFSERVWRTRHGSNGSVLTDLPFQLTWETSRLQAGEAGILTNFTGGEHGATLGQGSPAQQAAFAVQHLETLFPGIAATRAGMKESRFHWPSHPYTLGSYSCYLPGQWTGIGGAEGERVGRLSFAGEHTSQEAQGYMEGGCESGERAAREILEDLGLVQPEPAVA